MNKPTRILFWGLSSNLGGIESFIIDVYRNMDRNKVQIDFLTAHDKEELAYEDEIRAMGGNVYRVMYTERESLIKSRTSLKNFFKEHKEIKGVHIHANFPYAFPLKYAKKSGIDLRIIHSHNSNGDGGAQSFIGRLISRVRNKEIDKYPTHYFACSDLAADYMFPGKDYTWIKNGIDINKFKYNATIRKEIREELDISDDCQVIGFIGRFRNQKNPFFLIDIYREYAEINSNSKLLLAGMGEMEQQVKDYAKDLISDGKVLFLGRRTDAERLYQCMDAFLLPSLYEGLPVVLVESQTAGLPSFTTDVVTRQVDVTDLMHYYSLKESPKEWASKIYNELKKYKRKDYADEMIRAGFDMKSVAKNLEDFYVKNCK